MFFEISCVIFLLIIMWLYHTALKSRKEEAMFYKNKCLRMMGASRGYNRTTKTNELEREFLMTRR